METTFGSPEIGSDNSRFLFIIFESTAQFKIRRSSGTKSFLFGYQSFPLSLVKMNSVYIYLLILFIQPLSLKNTSDLFSFKNVLIWNAKLIKSVLEGHCIPFEKDITYVIYTLLTSLVCPVSLLCLIGSML